MCLYTNDKGESEMTKLDELMECIKQKHVFIQPHNYPDQDALASAYGLSYLLQTKGLDTTICYKGEIDKINTIAMVERLGIDVKKIEDIEFMNETSEIIIVDGQKGNVNMMDFVGNEIACIDHHKMQNTDMYRFADIRSGTGACASIITSYFIENNIEIPQNVATALFYGIKMDTNSLSRGVTDLDLLMYCKLFKIANMDEIRKLDSSTLAMEDLQAYACAINNLKVYNRVGIVNIGNDCAEAILGTMSDFILSLQEVTFSVVYSRRAGGIKFSVRSEDDRFDAAYIIQKALEGYGSGGGHASMAAGFVKDVDSDDMAEEISSVVEQRIVGLVGESLDKEN